MDSKEIQYTQAMLRCKNVVGRLVCTESDEWLGMVTGGGLCPRGPGELCHQDGIDCKSGAVTWVLRYMARLGGGPLEQHY